MIYQPDFPPVPVRLGLYPVVDSITWLERLLALGVKTLQIRIKDKPEHEVEQDIIQAINLGRRYEARLFINDYWRLAIKHRAWGYIWDRKIWIPRTWAQFAMPGYAWAFPLMMTLK